MTEIGGGLATPYQTYMHLSKYSRWREDLGRRETWIETIDRYLDFWDDRFPGLIRKDEHDWMRQALFTTSVVPSMRCLMTAGPALEKDECAGYNCTYMTISRPEAWDEAMYLLMCGVGVGYSVESRHVSQLPRVPGELVRSDEVIVVPDSKEGWASSLRRLVVSLYEGRIPSWSTALVRPEGSVLRTFGGRASGPAPLESLFDHVVDVFQGAAGRRLSNYEAHSVCCKIGDIVIVGGVRRSAMIALFSTDDHEMRTAKTGSWFKTDPHLGMANNSAVYESKPSPERFLEDFATLIKSQAGEPGIFNRRAAQEQASRWGKRRADVDYGCNPCGEIILQDRQMCNLSESIARGDDTDRRLLEKIEIATVFGTLQSTLTSFRYLDPEWSENCRSERLLGVSIAGIPDHALLNGGRGRRQLEEFLKVASDLAERTNIEWADRLGIEPSAASRCLKPSGNTSQLTMAASPLKPWHARHFVRRTRGSKTDPVSRLLIDHGVPHEDEAWHPESTVVFEWPHRAPKGAKTRHDWTALEQLELWRTYRDHWCDHNPSCTINVKSGEWLIVAEWVDRHWDKMTGITFLPDEDHSYVQAPYEEIDQDGYESLVARHPKVDWSLLELYEHDDLTESARELSCSAGACAI